jgi:hypothetical protein
MVAAMVGVGHAWERWLAWEREQLARAAARAAPATAAGG